MPGTLRLAQPADFALPGPSGERWLPPDGSLLACLLPDVPARPAAPGRIRLAGALDLLLADGVYVGWLLHRPELHLRDVRERPVGKAPDPQPDPELGTLLARYLDIDTWAEPGIDRLIDGDPEMLRELREIRQALTTGTGAAGRRALVVAKLDELVAEFFA